MLLKYKSFEQNINSNIDKISEYMIGDYILVKKFSLEKFYKAKITGIKFNKEYYFTALSENNKETKIIHGDIVRLLTKKEIKEFKMCIDSNNVKVGDYVLRIFNYYDDDLKKHVTIYDKAKIIDNDKTFVQFPFIILTELGKKELIRQKDIKRLLTKKEIKEFEINLSMNKYNL
jgi:hypothetical protein